jgi:hypothetical protein
MFKTIASNDCFTDAYQRKRRDLLLETSLIDKIFTFQEEQKVKKKHAIVIVIHSSCNIIFKPECLCIPKP